MAAETFQTNETETKLSKIYCSAPVRGEARPSSLIWPRSDRPWARKNVPRLRDPLIAEPIY